MILQPKDTTLAYRCPHCGATVFSVVGALALSGDIIKLKCQCGCSELTLENAEDDKIRLTVPCIFCPSPHRYKVSRKLLTSRELFTFPCAYANIDILFVGSKGAVMKAVEMSDRELAEIIDDTELAHIGDANRDDFYGDEHIRDTSFSCLATSPRSITSIADAMETAIILSNPCAKAFISPAKNADIPKRSPVPARPSIRRRFSIAQTFIWKKTTKQKIKNLIYKIGGFQK